MKIPETYSLSTRLLGLLFIAILLTSATQAYMAYITASAETDEIFDYHMQQMAMSFRSGLPLNALSLSNETPDDGKIDFVVQIWTANGLRVFQSSPSDLLPERAILGFSNLQINGANFRLFTMQTRTQTIQIAQDMAVRHAKASTLALRTIAPIPVMAPLLMLVAWWVVSASLSPVARLRRQVAERQADDLTELSEVGLPDEISPLLTELNLLFKRVSQAFEAQKHFVGDAAHELRSPLAALKLQVQGLRRATDDASRELAVSRLTIGIDRATRLIEQLLVLARQQASASTGVKPEPVGLSAMARFVVSDLASTAQLRQIDLGLGQTDPGEIAGHAEALRILVSNLVDNALKYTPSGGSVDIEVCRVADQFILSVDDSGPGIAKQDRERALDRFYRIAGTHATGSGLGLAIVKSIAQLHGATLTLDHSSRLGGLRVTVSFPALV